jgi:glycine hydroxymethyltransferase
VIPAERPWRSAPARQFAEEVLRDLPLTGLARRDQLAAAELDLLDSELHRLVDAQERHLDDCLVLYAGTNEPNPRLARLLGSPLGSRPNLGPPGDTYNRGMDDASRLSVLVDALLCRLFDAPFAESRVPSGSIANLYAYLASTRPGDRVMAFSDAAAGHATHHAAGAAGLAHLEVHEIPFDADRMDVDLGRAAALAASIRPRLVIVAGSMCLFPYDVRGLRGIADSTPARTAVATRPPSGWRRAISCARRSGCPSTAGRWPTRGSASAPRS